MEAVITNERMCEKDKRMTSEAETEESIRQAHAKASTLSTAVTTKTADRGSAKETGAAERQ